MPCFKTLPHGGGFSPQFEYIFCGQGTIPPIPRPPPPRLSALGGVC